MQKAAHAYETRPITVVILKLNSETENGGNTVYLNAISHYITDRFFIHLFGNEIYVLTAFVL